MPGVDRRSEKVGKPVVIDVGGVATSVYREVDAAKALGFGSLVFAKMIEQKGLPRPTAIDDVGSRWFSTEWIEFARAALTGVEPKEKVRVTPKRMAILVQDELRRRGRGSEG